jgi:hypothetical protein
MRLLRNVEGGSKHFNKFDVRLTGDNWECTKTDRVLRAFGGGGGGAAPPAN